MNLLDLHKAPFSIDTAIELINFVAEKLDGQYKSTNEYRRCVYRGLEGRKCAVGHLLPDELYDEKFDSGCYSYSRLIGELNIDMHMYYEAIIGACQKIHDRHSDCIKFSKDSFADAVKEEYRDSSYGVPLL